MRDSVRRRLRFLLVLCALLNVAWAQGNLQPAAKSKFDKLPAELQPTDPEVRSLLEQALADSETGAFDPAISKVEKALAVCTAKGLVADRAIAEASMGQAHFMKGQWKQAEQFERQALQHAIESSNLVLEADILVTLAALPRIEGDLPKALSILSDALDRAKRSRNHLIQSRVLSEMGALRLAMGKPKEARPLLERALEIDEVNDFDSRPLHMVYLAQVTLAESPSSLDSAMQQLEKARDLAVEKENYFALVLSCAELGKVYLGKGQVDKGLSLLENMNAGKAPTSEMVIKNPAAYRATLALPLYRSVVLGYLAFAYRLAKQEDRALHTFSDLYAYAEGAGFVEFEAGAADEIARSNQALGNNEAAIAYFRIAANKLRSLKYEAQLERTLASLADLLMRSGGFDEAGRASQEIVEIADRRNDAFYQFAARVDVARAHYQMKRLADAEKPLIGAELLIPALQSDSKLDHKMVAGQVLNLYVSQAQLYMALKRPIEALIAFEKAMLAAEDAKNEEAKKGLLETVRQSLEGGKVRDEADRAYKEDNLSAALIFYELLATFEATEARWNGRTEEWFKAPNPVAFRLLEIPLKLVAEPNGAQVLEGNLALMGRVAGIARISGNDALMGYYLRENKPDLAVEAGKSALDLLGPQRASIPYVRVVCQLAFAAWGSGNLDLAREKLVPCMESARQVASEDPKYLSLAQMLQSGILMSSNPSEALKAAETLAAKEPNDPEKHALVARIYEEQGKPSQAIAAWKEAQTLYEKAGDRTAVARSNLEIARLLEPKSRGEFPEKLSHLEAALSLYQGTSDLIGQSDTNLEIGKFYASADDRGKAAKYLEASVSLARQVGKDAVTAPALSQAGDAYKTLDDLPRSLLLHTEAAELYRKLKDPAAESSELQSVAWLLDDLKRTDEALENAQKAKQLADSSTSWRAQYSSRLELALLYGRRGDYDDPIRSIQLLKEAQRISDAAGEGKASAWIGLTLTWDLAMVGEWEEALSQVTAALKTCESLGDSMGSFRAFSQLMMIYGDRRSDIKDFDKALQAYEAARKIAQADPSNDISSLSDSLAEIYSQTGRLDDAIKSAQEYVAYSKKEKDEENEAHALMTLAEAQRGKGDLRAAAQALSKAEPLARKHPNVYTVGRLAYAQAGQARAEGRYREAVVIYEEVISRIEGLKSAASKEQQGKIAETYGFVYDELVETLYLLWMQGRDEESLLYAQKALQYSEANKAREFADSWGRIFVRELRKRLPAELQDRERSVVAKRNRAKAELEQANTTGSAESKKKAEEAVAAADREFDGLVQELRKTYPAYASVRFP